MKVTIFQYEKLTGYDTFVFNFTRALMKSGHSVTVVTSDQFPLIGGERILSKHEISSRLGASQWIELQFLRIIPHPKSLSLLRKILASSDVVYVKNEVLDLLPILMVARGTGTPVVCGVHTMLLYTDWRSLRSRIHNTIYGSTFYSVLLSACDIIHVINTYDKELLEKAFGVAPSKLYFLPLWVDAEEYKPRTEPRTNQRFRILFIGSLDRRKGVDVLLQSVAKLCKENYDKFVRMTFTIVGTGPLADCIREVQAKCENIEYRTTVTEELVDLYNEHDVLVLPSRGETFSYVTLEALSCGLPVIASDIPGPNSLIEKGITGMLFPVGDMHALTNAILSMYHLWVNRNKYDVMRSECRHSVLRRFSSNYVAYGLEKLLERTSKIKSRTRSGELT